MDYLNRLKNTLTSTVNEIAHALPGNPLLREYDAGEQVASAGPDYIWKIYDGTKKSTKAKRQLEQYPKSSREIILECARKGVVQLTKLRHPRILTVEHAVEESRDSLVFCTEPVFASLGNVLGTKKNISDIPTPLRAHNLYDVEIKYGILQITEGLSFLHESAKMLHGNLCPESIIINKQGVWKLGGFDFCVLNSNQGGELRHLSNYDLKKFPKEVIDHEKMLLHPDSRVRPDADQMGKLPYFEDIGVVTLQYLDNILQRDNLQKSQFYKELSQVLPKLPKRVVMQRILPSLCAEFTNKDMLPFVLPHLMTIAEDCDDSEYKTQVFPSLIPVFKVQSPVQVLLILLQKMDMLLKKTPKDLVQAHILPMICNALSAPSLKIQELCLSIIPNFARLLEMPLMKNSIMPKIKKIVWEGGTASVRINGLVCIGKLLPMLDKWFVYDEVFPILFQMKSREPGILMAILGIFQATFNNKKLGISKDILATKVIPYLMPFTVDINLNSQQFNTFMTVIKEMLQRVENDQRSKLEQVSHAKVDESTKNFKKLTSTSNSPVINDSKKEVNGALGIGKTNSAPSNEFVEKRQHLTLEEKQKLAKANEMQYRMKKQGELKPQQLYDANAGKKNQPKDLTSTLMQNNVPVMKTPGNTNARMPQQQTIGKGGMRMGAPYMTPMMTNNVAQPNYMTSMSSRPTTPYSGAFPTSMQSGQTRTMTPIAQQNSSLDHLLSMPSQAKTPTLNNMQGSYQMQQYAARPISQGAPNSMSQNAFNMANPFMSPTPLVNNGQSNSSNPLSKQDLLDFLG